MQDRALPRHFSCGAPSDSRPTLPWAFTHQVQRGSQKIYLRDFSLCQGRGWCRWSYPYGDSSTRQGHQGM